MTPHPPLIFAKTAAGVLLLGAAMLLAPTVQATTPPGEVEASIEPSDNLCLGGLEDGKIIVGESYLKNPYRETTRLGCEVDGGAPVTMPDLPAPDAAKTRLA